MKVLRKNIYTNNLIIYAILLCILLLIIFVFLKGNSGDNVEKAESLVHIQINNRVYEYYQKMKIKISINNKIVFDSTIGDYEKKSVFVNLYKVNNELEINYNNNKLYSDTLKAESEEREYALTLFIDPDKIQDGNFTIKAWYDFYPFKGY